MWYIVLVPGSLQEVTVTSCCWIVSFECMEMSRMVTAWDQQPRARPSLVWEHAVTSTLLGLIILLQLSCCVFPCLMCSSKVLLTTCTTHVCPPSCPRVFFMTTPTRWTTPSSQPLTLRYRQFAVLASWHMLELSATHVTHNYCTTTHT